MEFSNNVLRRMRRSIETTEKEGRPSLASPSTPASTMLVCRVVSVTSLTLTDSRYPGQVMEYDEASNAYSTLGVTCWVQGVRGLPMSVGRYFAYLLSIKAADGLAIFVATERIEGDAAHTKPVGDGVTTAFVIPQSEHGLSTDAKMTVGVYDSSTGKLVYPGIAIDASTGTVTVTFKVAPTTDQYLVVIQKAGGIGSGPAIDALSLSATTHNHPVTGGVAATVLAVTPTANGYSLTGLLNMTPGQQITIINADTTYSFSIPNASGSSTKPFKTVNAATQTLLPGQVLTFVYDGTVLKQTGASVPLRAAFSGAKLYLSGGGQTIVGGAAAAVSFSSISFDTDSYADLGTHPTRLTAPDAGYYHIGASLRWNILTVTGKMMYLTLVANGGVFGAAARVLGSTIDETIESGSAPIFLNAGDYIEVIAGHGDITHGIDVEASDGTNLWIYRIG